MSEFVAVTFVTYRDGHIQTSLLASGSREQCESVFNATSAVAVHGAAQKATIVVMSKDEYDQLLARAA